MSSSVTPRTLLSAAALVVGITIAGKVVGLGKELVLAHRFGLGDAMDAFLLANVIPGFLINVLAGSVPAALIPIYLQVRRSEGAASADRLAAGVTTAATIGLGAVTLIAAVSLSWILPVFAAGFSVDKLDLATSLSWVVLPVVVLSGVTSALGGILNAHNRFSLAAWSPAVVPAAIAVTVLLVPLAGIHGAAVGLLVGTVLQVLLLGVGVARAGVSAWPRRNIHVAERSRLVAQYLPAVGGACLMTGTVLVDQAMAATLSPGSLSALNYGSKLPALGVGLVATALATVALPHFGRMVADQDWTRLRSHIGLASRLVLGLSVPATVMLVLLSSPLVRLIYQRGAFQASDVAVVASVQAYLLLQVPVHLLGIVYVRLISALQQNRILLWGAAICLPLNVLLNYILMQRMGVAGIALSTSLVYCVSCGYLIITGRRALASASAGPRGEPASGPPSAQ